ncbi:glutamine amidotransferase [Oscillatoria laete-virens NRMC-F 0139]|nr:glutamine amidotransferase [Oscillatoria laete-virens]MDL5055065.1 glutamine amidotransferase [Oscillatoria laete-virens NRMC-F 0139]
MKPILVIKAGTTFPRIRATCGDVEKWYLDALGPFAPQAKVCAAYEGDDLPEPEQIAAVIISGAHCMVTEKQPWSEKIARWLPEVIRREIPVLGVCYGHQLLIHALGGEVGYHPQGTEEGTVPVQFAPEAAADPLFGSFPTEIKVHASHSQTALRLPPGAIVLGSNSFEPHHVVRFAPRAWGVQFHPEFTETIMRLYIEEDAPALREEGKDPAAALSTVTATPESSRIIGQFARWATSL